MKAGDLLPRKAYRGMRGEWVVTQTRWQGWVQLIPRFPGKQELNPGYLIHESYEHDLPLVICE